MSELYLLKTASRAAIAAAIGAGTLDARRPTIEADGGRLRIGNHLVTETDVQGATVSTAGTTTLALKSQCAQHVALITVSAGAGAYTRKIVAPRLATALDATTLAPVTGDTITIRLAFAASVNPAIAIYEATDTGTLLLTVNGTGSAFARTVQLTWNGAAWVLLDDGARSDFDALGAAAAAQAAAIAAAAADATAKANAVQASLDAAIAGLDLKAKARAASTANLTLSGAQTIDGIAIVAGDRVLVKNQSSAAQNGIYVAASGAWVRASDFDAWSEIPSALVPVETGTVNGDKVFLCTSDAGGSLGSTAITFSAYGGSSFAALTGVPADNAALASALAAAGGVQMRSVAVTLSRIVGAVAATPASQTITPASSLVPDGTTFSVTKGATTIVYENDSASDGIGEGNVLLTSDGDSGGSPAANCAAALVTKITADFSSALTATWNGTDLTVATVASGASQSFSIVCSDARFSMAASGTDGIAATGARAARFLPAESGKKHVFLRVTHDFGATPDWTNPINVGYAAFTAGSGGTAGSPLAAPFVIAGTGGAQANVTAPVIPPVASLQVPPTNTDATAWMSGADETVSTNPLTITALIATMPA